MSGVLDRVVARTRGMLPSAEPRITASVAHPGDVTMADEWQGEIAVEQEDAGVAPARRRTPLPAVRSDAPEEVWIQASRGERAARKSHSDEGVSERSQSGVKRDPMLQQAAVPVTRGPEEWMEAGDRHEKGEAAVPVRERAVEARPAAVRESVAPMLQPTASEAAVEPSGANQRADEDHPSMIHEHREVFISIGTVSMEAAPQPVVRSAASAFRPRVSLDAFLERRQEGRR